MEFQELTIDCKELIQKHLSYQQYGATDMSFAHLYAWRNRYNIRFAVVHDMCCVVFCDPFEPVEGHICCMLMPFGAGDLGAAITSCRTYFEGMEQTFCMKGLTNNMIADINASLPEQFDYTAIRDTFDYIYSMEDLINLTGKKYHSKRNFINTFQANYAYEYLPLTTALIDPCLDMLYAWEKAKLADENMSEYDRKLLAWETEAMGEMLQQFAHFGVKGGAILVEGKVIAFTLGEQITKDTCLIHAEKADYAFRGIYPMINQAFLKNTFAHLKYVNREEDAGIEGLRKAKQSYYPVFLLEKSMATVKGVAL
ncbi:MAG: DUF2156 domain-containing protein [Hyphomonadaceae bacterium]|nr:DUF2156 domain-containing protein [Clostridia bacterium]